MWGPFKCAKPAARDPPPGLLSQAYSGAIFQIRYSPKELFCVARLYALATSWLVTGLVTVDGNSKGRGRGVFVIDRWIGPMSGVSDDSADGWEDSDNPDELGSVEKLATMMKESRQASVSKSLEVAT